MYEMLEKNRDKGRKGGVRKAAKSGGTGIPAQMKAYYEDFSGMSFDDVRVHYASAKPAGIGALAYTQGNQIYVGPGQEKHLGHELAHVVQQKQGRVAPTGNIGGMPANADPALEKEADRISSALESEEGILITGSRKATL